MTLFVAGRYLPLTSSLGAILKVQPKDFQAAISDVIRLGNVSSIKAQQGYVQCDPFDESDSTRKGPLHLAVQVLCVLP